MATQDGISQKEMLGIPPRHLTQVLYEFDPAAGAGAAGFKAYSLGFKFQDLGFRAADCGYGFRLESFEFKVEGLASVEFEIQGGRFRV